LICRLRREILETFLILLFNFDIPETFIDKNRDLKTFKTEVKRNEMSNFKIT
jgi:hypothetical protein